MFKKPLGLIIALTGIAILVYIVYYQAKTKESFIMWMPIGLIICFGGIFLYKYQNRK